MGGDSLDQWGEGRVEQQCSIFRVIDDVDQLLRVQTRIAGVHDHAAAGHRVISFEMPVIVPGNRSDHGAGVKTQVTQGVRQTSNAYRAFGAAISKHRAVRLARDDLRISELRSRMFDDAGNQQRPIHHQSWLQHVNLAGSSGSQRLVEQLITRAPAKTVPLIKRPRARIVDCKLQLQSHHAPPGEVAFGARGQSASRLQRNARHRKRRIRRSPPSSRHVRD